MNSERNEGQEFVDTFRATAGVALLVGFEVFRENPWYGLFLFSVGLWGVKPGVDRVTDKILDFSKGKQ